MPPNINVKIIPSLSISYENNSENTKISVKESKKIFGKLKIIYTFARRNTNN